MSNGNIIKELTEAEAALMRLSTAVQEKTKNPELKEDYYSLVQQACLALNKIRSIAETDEFFKGDSLKNILNKVSEIFGKRQ